MTLILLLIPSVLFLLFFILKSNDKNTLIKQSSQTAAKFETVKELILNILKSIGILSFIPFLAPYIPPIADLLTYINLNIDDVANSVFLIWNVLIALWAKIRLIVSAARIRAVHDQSNNLTSSL